MHCIHAVCVWCVSECIYVVWICESSLCVYVLGVHRGEMRKEEWIDKKERGRWAERTRRWRRRGTTSLGCTTMPLRGATQAWCVRAMSFASLVTVQHMLWISFLTKSSRHFLADCPSVVASTEQKESSWEGTLHPEWIGQSWFWQWVSSYSLAGKTHCRWPSPPGLSPGVFQGWKEAFSWVFQQVAVWPIIFSRKAAVNTVSYRCWTKWAFSLFIRAQH